MLCLCRCAGQNSGKVARRAVVVVVMLMLCCWARQADGDGAAARARGGRAGAACSCSRRRGRGALPINCTTSPHRSPSVQQWERHVLGISTEPGPPRLV